MRMKQKYSTEFIILVKEGASVFFSSSSSVFDLGAGVALLALSI